MLKKLSLVFAVLFLGGCGSQAVKVDVTDIAKSERIVVKDLRPPKEKLQQLFSAWITSEDYGISRKGDDMLEPPAVRLLQHRLYESLGRDQINPTSLIVHHFVIYQNVKTHARRGALFAVFGGIVGAAVAIATENKAPNRASVLSSSLVDGRAFEGLAGEEYKRAFFEPEENEQNVPAFVAYLDAEFDGKRVFVKTVSPALENESIKSPISFAVESVIQEFIAKLPTAVAVKNTDAAAARKDSPIVPAKDVATPPAAQSEKSPKEAGTGGASKASNSQQEAVGSAKPVATSSTQSDPVFAAIDDIAAIPYVGDAGRNAYREYLEKPAPKAFAIASNGGAYSVWGKSRDLSLPADSSERALVLCERVAKRPCKIYAVNSTVVWNARVEK
jgi:hypothetical protein